MPKLKAVSAALSAAFVVFFALAPAKAQTPRFVSATGSDANACTTPAGACRTFQRAHDAAGAGGKIIALNTGDYSSVVITKSISIIAVGVDAVPFGGSTDKIVINAGPDDVVYLDGLNIGRDQISADNSGIRFNSGGQLHVRNCVIRRFSRAGITIAPPGPSRVEISDSKISNNQNGVIVEPTGSKNVVIFLDRVTVSSNVDDGIRADGNRAHVRISGSTIIDNGTGLRVLNSGKIISFGNNVVFQNTTNGEPTATVGLK
ncbi:MAG: hypothetical protein GEU91_15365 [Rhizobiales bacterium]|nr:hypothetical protein [Hyphomicrobiales bacterium]